MCELWDDLNDRYAPPVVVKELARMALAAMDSEPVAWGNGCDKTVPAALRYLAENERPFGGESRFNAAHLYQLAREIELMAEAPLYRHTQPVPVVPEEATPDSIEILASARRRDRAVFQWDEDQRNAAADSWNACRATMLLAEPQNAPQNIPEIIPGWIPVSDRMPGNGVQVLVSDVSGHVFVCHHDGSFWVDFRVGIGKRCITHWMPLPAAPQEVNHG
ncbi:TPA: DUF551 domain-containing protein [Klebsiella variicola subsp. variicola]|nr:DUF551 domain-containing protein [Klebsiella variicola subsp. variicola]